MDAKFNRPNDQIIASPVIEAPSGCFITIACLALAVSGEQTSFSSFSAHGKTYGYNHGHHGAPSYPQQAPAHTTPAPTHPKPTPAAAPAYPAHPPAYPKPAPYHPAPAYAPYKPAPAYAPYKPAPAYAPYKPAPYQPAPYKQPAYSHETTQAQFYLLRPLLTKSTATFPNVLSVPSPLRKSPMRSAPTTTKRDIKIPPPKPLKFTFKKETNVQMVTVCQPGYGHGYQAYGHQYCKEVAQETAYNVPVVTPIDVPVKVSYPEPIKTCVNKPISLPRVSCSDIQEKMYHCSEIEESVQTVEKCSTKLGAPSCQQIELSLPKQVCIELVYGYAHDTKEAETYA
ncbi:unnamed protein product [Lepeophtheirus salmonis]|uniref:(salmon louse) hypothetical protein n=1 Tax=Lepeophtheirus salmonis TaxID=72036 RepID=A0A7R8D3Q5_LEPSM|nr:unnamed protein product [Lepeophtheirus salmonis]CAF3018432.1 unnamed protein product [Lepeophtheirus salmonis]